jgi:predicted small lipoprotein YifL
MPTVFTRFLPRLVLVAAAAASLAGCGVNWPP